MTHNINVLFSQLQLLDAILKKQHEALLINNTTLCETWAKFPHKNRKDKNNQQAKTWQESKVELYKLQ